ncbi:hypothetical protein EVAR_78711_1 [Eumeta japonica]|uniref:Uncharacterized protein n=1 Tax=Eumeta variegata TaxID=151549 RepID=A0A4C1T427_EUMVA|nr:hypothetical protein EVAR_78711_1 [Eumeta japonica]
MIATWPPSAVTYARAPLTARAFTFTPRLWLMFAPTPVTKYETGRTIRPQTLLILLRIRREESGSHEPPGLGLCPTIVIELESVLTTPDYAHVYLPNMKFKFEFKISIVNGLQNNT